MRSNEGEGALCLYPFLQEDGGSTELGAPSRDRPAPVTCRRASLATFAVLSMAGCRPGIGYVLVTWVRPLLPAHLRVVPVPGDVAFLCGREPLPRGGGRSRHGPLPSSSLGRAVRSAACPARCDRLEAGWEGAVLGCGLARLSFPLSQEVPWLVSNPTLGLAPRPFYRKTP